MINLPMLQSPFWSQRTEHICRGKKCASLDPPPGLLM